MLVQSDLLVNCKLLIILIVVPLHYDDDFDSWRTILDEWTGLYSGQSDSNEVDGPMMPEPLVGTDLSTMALARRLSLIFVASS